MVARARQITLILIATLGIAVWGVISAMNGLLIAHQLGQGNFLGGMVLSFVYVLLPVYMLYRFVRLAIGFRDRDQVQRIGLPLMLTLFAPFAEIFVISG